MTDLETRRLDMASPAVLALSTALGVPQIDAAYVLAALELDGYHVVTEDSLAAALHQKGYCWEGNAECSPREHRYEAQLLIQAAKKASE